MSDHRLFETDEFKKQLSKISLNQQTVLQNKLENYVYPQLRVAPYYGPNIKKLRGYNPETWRYRIGNYRIFYLVDDDSRVVFILTIDQRKDAYK